MAGVSLVLATDRTSNGAHVYYPAPAGPGGTGQHEDVVMDNFNHDPFVCQTGHDVAQGVVQQMQAMYQKRRHYTLKSLGKVRPLPCALASNRPLPRRASTHAAVPRLAPRAPHTPG